MGGGEFIHHLREYKFLEDYYYKYDISVLVATGYGLHGRNSIPGRGKPS
jgi:hypothetical protein